MHTGIWLMRVICPTCKHLTIGFVGDNEDGSFYCQGRVLERGEPSICGESWEKLHHMPEGCVEQLARIDFRSSESPDTRLVGLTVQRSGNWPVSVVQ